MIIMYYYSSNLSLGTFSSTQNRLCFNICLRPSSSNTRIGTPTAPHHTTAILRYATINHRNDNSTTTTTTPTTTAAILIRAPCPRPASRVPGSYSSRKWMMLFTYGMYLSTYRVLLYTRPMAYQLHLQSGQFNNLLCSSSAACHFHFSQDHLFLVHN